MAFQKESRMVRTAVPDADTRPASTLSFASQTALNSALRLGSKRVLQCHFNSSV